MKATSECWRQFHFLYEDGLNVLLANDQHVKNMPGRKTDVAAVAWLAQLGACGLVRASLAPPEPIRRLRDLNRTRHNVHCQRASEIQRVEKLLEVTSIRLPSVATDLTGVSSRAMLGVLTEVSAIPRHWQISPSKACARSPKR